MGPLIPQGIIQPEWNYVIALLIGIAFGFILEASGFSSSKKLVGVFYGYDFVVLRVFFTAAVTAMVGLLYFHHLGWVDLELLYINPLYLRSALVGGVVMGAGFIIGGFCPGTAMCAISIGKLDALAFGFGIILGVFMFGETYALWEELHKGSFLGSPKIFDTVGVSEGLFAFVFVGIALVAFYVTAKIEKNVNAKRSK